MQPAPAAPPRSVARTTVASGQTVIGAPVEPTTTTEAVQPGAVAPVKPSAPTARPKPVKQAPTRKILPGDLICGECGEGNPPARNFCSRCGAGLKNAAVAKRPWWKKLIPQRRRKTLEAGARTWKTSDGATKKRRGGKLAKVYLKLRPIVAGALLLSGMLVGFTPNLREKVTDKVGDWRQSAESKLNPSFKTLHPIKVTATTQSPEHVSDNLIDSNTLTAWHAAADDAVPILLVEFDQPFDLERIKLWNGPGEEFKKHERASDLHFVFDNGKFFDLHLDDATDGVEYEIKNGEGVRVIEIQIVGTYSSLAEDDVAIREIEFFLKT